MTHRHRVETRMKREVVEKDARCRVLPPRASTFSSLGKSSFPASISSPVHGTRFASQGLPTPKERSEGKQRVVGGSSQLSAREEEEEEEEEEDAHLAAAILSSSGGE